MRLWSYAMTPAHLAENGVERARRRRIWVRMALRALGPLRRRLRIFLCDLRNFPPEPSAAALGLLGGLAGPAVDPAERAHRLAQVVLVQLGELEANRGVVDLSGE